MKKTILISVAVGLILGLLSGGSIAVDLSFLSGMWAIGFYATPLFLAAAFGGPLAALISVLCFLILSGSFGPPPVKALVANPIIFWTNVFVLGGYMSGVALTYRRLYARLKMPMRLLPWAGIIFFYYLAAIPLLAGLQYLLGYPFADSYLDYILASWKGFAPQALSDVVISSLVFSALSEKFRRPLWIPRTKTAKARAEKASGG